MGQAADLSNQTPIDVVVELGTVDGELSFTPNKLSFETGKLYKLILKNPSPVSHYFSALRFAAAVWTRKVETAFQFLGSEPPAYSRSASAP